MGKNRERVRSCFSPRLKPPRQTRGRPQFIAAERITPRAATAFKIYYAVKSHLAAARRIVEGCWNTCAALLRAVDAARLRFGTGRGAGTAATSAALPHDAARRHIAAPPQDEISLRNKS